MRNDSEQGRQFHAKAAEAREAGNIAESLVQNEYALLAYAADSDVLGLAESVACRSITLRVHAEQLNNTNSRNLLILAKFEMMGAVQIARESSDLTAIPLPLFNLAKLQESLQELPDAVASFKEAVEGMENHPPERHNRPSVLADMQVHLATCEYRNGDKTALEKAKQAMNNLQAAEEPNQYAKDVWVSGGYMRIADMLRTDDPVQAQDYLAKAKEIIEANPELKLRKEQWEKLAATFSSK